jgi:hypothetical protein
MSDNIRNPRLPALPFDGYRPPVTPEYRPPAPPPQGQVTPGTEYFSQTINAPGDSVEQRIYTTQQQWRAVDVYVDVPDPMKPETVITIRVYALIGGQRTVVATGRLGNISQLFVLTKAFPTWVAAARAQSTKFEITLEHQGLALGGRVTVSLVATNLANDPPAWVGDIRASAAGAAVIVNSVRIPDPELVIVQGAINEGVVGARFLHIHDRPFGSPFAGLIPAFSIPLGNAGGQGGSWPLPFRSQSGFIVVVPSSTNAVTTEVFDCSVQAVFR